MRIAEAYIGEYASGKSEVAVNRALALKAAGNPVVLADLDLVEPCYTLRPLKKKLLKKGIEVIAWTTSEMIGLGETGCLLHPAMRWVLKKPGNLVLDIGYGVYGAKILDLLVGAETDADLKIYAVVNLGRPMTSEKEEIIVYLKSLGRLDGLINNSHLGENTTLAFIEQGATVIQEVAKVLGVPIIATTTTALFAPEMASKVTHPVWVLERYMQDTLW